MIQRYVLGAGLILGLFATGCTLPFTKDLQARLDTSSIKVESVQFYNSARIGLERDVTSEEASVSEGKILLRGGQRIEVIVIRPLTPGLCMRRSKDGQRLYTAFEEGRGRALVFKFDYDWFYLSPDTAHSVLYDGKVYRLQPLPLGNRPHLRVKKSEFFKLIKERRVVQGLRVE